MTPTPHATPSSAPRWTLVVVVMAVLLSLAALAFAWNAQQRMLRLEQELVRRQQGALEQATEAKLLAKQSQDLSRESAAKTTLLETRLAEVTVQRTQLDDLIQSLARSRDDNLIVDIEAGLRVALQQTAITGSAESLVAALKTADERLERLGEARLEPVRRAIARDLERTRSVGVSDSAALAIKLDEATRLVDEAPLLMADAARAAAKAQERSMLSRQAAASPTLAASAPDVPAWLPASVQGWVDAVWDEASGLLRVTRIDRPEAMLLAPEQGFFLRENLKLRLLNARLALLSRQFDTAQADLQAALGALDRYFDRGSRRTVALNELLRSVAAQARLSSVPRPDETLAALAAASGR
jgi:uroporphyrin-3 C-methyltransferase